MKQSQRELQKGGEIPDKLTHKTTELPKFNSPIEINVQSCQESHTIHQVINKRNQT